MIGQDDKAVSHGRRGSYLDGCRCLACTKAHVTLQRRITWAVMNVGHQIPEKLDQRGGILWCASCKAKRDFGSVALYLSDGWPFCCDAIMIWWTQDQLAAGHLPSESIPTD